MRAARSYLLSAPFLRIWLLSFCAGAAGFLLFPTAPLRLRELGAPLAAAGAFLTGLTFASALSAAWTGAVGDVLGRRRVLTVATAGVAGFGVVYAAPLPWPLWVLLAVPHGALWSALLTAGSSEAARVVPLERRAEGLGYHGLAMSGAIAVAPPVGFALLALGWTWLCAALVAANLCALALARGLPADPPFDRSRLAELSVRRAVEWRVLRLSIVLFACSFGYGGATSFVALFAEERGIARKGIFFTAFALAVISLRPFLGPLVDRVGARRALPPTILAIAVALALLPFQTTATGLAAAAFLFGAGFSTLYPAFATLVLLGIEDHRRGAAFGAMLASFDVGIGLGSLGFGPIVSRFGYEAAFVASAVLAASAWPLLSMGLRAWEPGQAAAEG
jgi:MFS family permease